MITPVAVENVVNQYGPGVPGARFSSVDTSHQGFYGAQFTDDGAVVFRATLRLADASEHESLWIWRNGEMTELLRAGDPFDIDDGPGVDIRIIDQVRVDNSLNRSGKLAATLHFTTGEQGVFTTDVAGAPPCPADVSGDGVVGSSDLAVLLGCWGPAAGGCLDADADGNGIINSADLAAMLGGWGACP